jgi:hypothetical protein
MWRGGMAGMVAVSAGMGGPSFGDQKTASLAYKVNRARNDGILICRQRLQGGQEVRLERGMGADQLRRGKQTAA